MVWPFTAVQTVSFKKSINASAESVLELLHDPALFLSMDPLIIKVKPETTHPSNSSYTITDCIIVARYFAARRKYQCQVRLQEDGLHTDIVASLGTRLKRQYKVAGRDNGTTEITEETTVEALFLMVPYIVRTMSTTHQIILENLAAKAENRSDRPVRNIRVDAKLSGFSKIYFILPILVFLLAPYSNPFRLSLFIVLVVTILGFNWFRPTTGDPYGLFHLTLNRRPGECEPETEWLNMGFWRNTKIFPQACEALATKLIHAAQCHDGDRILDVGHGTGESLIFLLSGPSIPRPSSITGITSLSAQHFRSQGRVDRLLACLQSPPEVHLHLGDAVYHQPMVNHPLDPSSPVMYDRILALDCAYHFNTRNAFLRQAFYKLSPGARIALADMCFDTKSLKSRRFWFLTSIFKLFPKKNLISAESYVTQMREIGYSDVELEDITQDVFPGFIQFLKSQGLGWRIFALIIAGYANGGARFVVVSGSRV